MNNIELCWVEKKGAPERVLELWDGPRKICGIVELEDQRALERALALANVMVNGDGEPINEDGETFAEVEERHERELSEAEEDRETSDEEGEKADRLMKAISTARQDLRYIIGAYGDAMKAEDEFGESLESRLDRVSGDLFDAEED